MAKWSQPLEEELTVLLKDWLKHHGRTQADLGKSLSAVSSRMPSLIEVLEREYSLGGLPRLAHRLCKVEEDWSSQYQECAEQENIPEVNTSDPFGQLDLLLDEIREDCET